MNNQRTLSPISVWSPKGSRSMSGCREQASITALYLDNTKQTPSSQMNLKEINVFLFLTAHLKQKYHPHKLTHSPIRGGTGWHCELAWKKECYIAQIRHSTCIHAHMRKWWKHRKKRNWLYLFLPLFIERAAEGDVFLYCSVEQPGLLSSVGHRVSVLAGCIMGNRGKQTGKNYKSCIHKLEVAAVLIWSDHWSVLWPLDPIPSFSFSLSFQKFVVASAKHE